MSPSARAMFHHAPGPELSRAVHFDVHPLHSHSAHGQQGASLRRTRIVLAGISRMLSDIITDIVTSHAATVAEAEADVVVLGLPDEELPSEYAGLLSARPQTRLLGVSGDGRRAFLYELRPYRSALGEVSPQTLLDAIRAAARPS